MAGWGKPKYTTSFSQTTSIKEGDNIWRYLPPMHSLAESGDWSNYHCIHYGRKVPNPSDPEKLISKPYRCAEVYDRMSKAVIQECPECMQVREKEKERDAKREELTKKYKAQGKSDREIDELLDTALKSLNDWIQRYQVDRKHYINVMSPDGKIFKVLKVNHKYNMAGIKKLFSDLRDENIEPLELDQGVLVNIQRTGKGRSAVDNVKAVTRKVDVEVNGVKKRYDEIVIRPLTEEEADRALKECRDLAEVGGIPLTLEQVQELVDSSGDPEEIQKLFDKFAGKKSDSSKKSDAAQKPLPEPEDESLPEPEPVKQPEPPKPAPKGLDKNDPRVQARLASIQAKKEAEEKARLEAEAQKLAAEKSKAASKAETDEVNPFDLSDEEFAAWSASQSSES